VKASDNPVGGRWRILEADLWGRDHLDLCGPAYLIVRANGDGEISFGALQASLDIDYGPNGIGFTWAWFDEMTEVSSAGSAEIQDDGTLLLEFEYHLGDEAVLKAVRGASSTACWKTCPRNRTAHPPARQGSRRAINNLDPHAG
jgi:hypothetical protein